MNSNELALLRELNQYFIRIHNALTEGNLPRAGLNIASAHVAIGLIIQGLRKQKQKVSNEFVSEFNARQKELVEYLNEVARLKALDPDYNRPTEHLYNLLLELPGPHARSYRVLLLPEERLAVEERLRNPALTAYAIEDISRDAVGFKDFMAGLKGEESIGDFLPPDNSQIPYYVSISYKPRFFGLMKGKTTESYVWMSLQEETQLNRFLASDPEVADFAVANHNPNVDRDGLSKAFDELGI